MKCQRREEARLLFGISSLHVDTREQSNKACRQHILASTFTYSRVNTPELLAFVMYIPKIKYDMDDVYIYVCSIPQ